MARLRYNGVRSALGGTGLAPAGTTITFTAALAHAGGAVPTITGSDYIPLTIYGTDGLAEEIVWLTAYTSGALTGTITRAQEGTTAATHAAGAVVDHGPTALDFTAATVSEPEAIGVALSDETTAITTGAAKTTIRMPFAMTLTAVRASLTSAASAGLTTVDINEGGTSILSTKLTIDATEKTSTTAATAAVISDTALADDAEVTFDIDAAGTDAKGLKVWLIGTRA